MIHRWAHNLDIGHLIIRQEAIVVSWLPNIPFWKPDGTRAIWRFRRLHGWHLVKVIAHTHEDGRYRLCPPLNGGWLNVLRGCCR